MSKFDQNFYTKMPFRPQMLLSLTKYIRVENFLNFGPLAFDGIWNRSGSMDGPHSIITEVSADPRSQSLGQI